jgi:hypothetical protein
MTEPLFNNEETVDILLLKENAVYIHTSMDIPFTVPVIFAGGAFVRMLNADLANEKFDHDLFVLCGFDEKDYRDQLYKIKDLLATNSRFTFRASPYMPSSKSHIWGIVDDKHTKRQYIFSKCRTRSELMSTFDFMHCCISFDGKSLYISPKAYRCAKRKILELNNASINNPSKTRIQKFWKAGFIMEDPDLHNQLVKIVSK